MTKKRRRPAFTYGEIDALIEAANVLERNYWDDASGITYSDLINARERLVAVSNLFAEEHAEK